MPTITDHLLNPGLSTDQYVNGRNIALGQEISTRRPVYLDTKFWIILRDTDRGAGNPESATLLALLRKGVGEGLLFCPISEDIFVELMKQQDDASRLATASLVDELSLGVTLVPQNVRMATEVTYFMYATTGTPNLHPLNHLIWCKLSYVLGILHPTNTIFDSGTERAIQKAFFDHMSTIPLREIVTRIGEIEIPGTDLTEVANKLNAGNFAHKDEIQSYEQSYSAEVRGVVDLMGDAIHQATMMLAESRGIVLNERTAEQKRVAENGFKNLLAISLERNKSRDTLRTIHILASLHASVRWNKGRKLKGNDFFDFHHAAAAIAYCDAFFTERSLRTTITQSHLSLDKLYGCFVTSEASDAISWLRDLQ
ncbi:hypothetical protein M2360_004265 [Rhizobium sp. SG_E_25_P2]|uniref:hypothetical protein n=1 Tax=Rhizobium sp. SG_E_25_P2 TaxID=2879942 RepID=UPI0024767C1B|nr:hypothetical protein [Rhizobium sp. SG_E_25_P2]MDH6268846.1 hypothetical protein [Rhizobium sp. SG_E_25_P2]